MSHVSDPEGLLNDVAGLCRNYQQFYHDLSTRAGSRCHKLTVTVTILQDTFEYMYGSGDLVSRLYCSKELDDPSHSELSADYFDIANSGFRECIDKIARLVSYSYMKEDYSEFDAYRFMEVLTLWECKVGFLSKLYEKSLLSFYNCMMCESPKPKMSSLYKYNILNSETYS